MTTTKILDDLVFGLARTVGYGGITITIELEKKSADAFCWQLMKDIEPIMREHGRESPIVRIGSPFEYRGVKFRIIES